MMKTQGHSANCGGLRGHSIGDLYPFIVFGKGIEPTMWHILRPDGTESPLSFSSVRSAHMYAGRLKKRWEGKE